MDNTETLATLGTQDAERRQTKHKNRAQHRKQEKISYKDPLRKREWTQVLQKGQRFLRCYSYIEPSPIKVLSVIEERKHLRSEKET